MRRSTRRAWLVTSVVLLATVPAVTQEMGPPVPPETSSAWTSFEGSALLAEPIELSLSAALREQCEGFALPPEPMLLHAPELSSNSELAELAGLGDCVRAGPLEGYELELFGASELPARHEYPVESSGPADVVRASLGRVGVPFSSILIRDVDLDPLSSGHGSARVRVGVSGESLSSEEGP